MKILYKNECLELIPITKFDFCRGCCFSVRGRYCQAPPILNTICSYYDRVFKRAKKDIFYES